KVEIRIFKSNLPFHHFKNLTWGFKKLMRFGRPFLQAIISEYGDPIIEQELTDILSTSIKRVDIGEWGSSLSSSDYSICAQLLRSSNIENLLFGYVNLNNVTAHFIKSIIARATNHLGIWLGTQTQLTDPAAFIESLCTLPISVRLNSRNFDSNSFFGLPTT
ncbi:hypothetical protein PMAYCL1PPCAC_27931, partial [Pristionchus mayeri]